MNYDGGKNGEGVYQAIINQMPPHTVYIEAFTGSGAVIRRKRPAAVNIALEIDPITIAAVKPILSTGSRVVETDCVNWLRSQFQLHVPAGEVALVYADPPYLMETRSCQRPLYRHEFSTEQEHREFLTLAKTIPALWMISGYPSKLYEEMLSDWRVVTFQSPTRRGMRTEYLWCNFPDPVELHDYSFLGSNNTDRQRIKRKKERWKTRLSKMSSLERMAVLSAIAEWKSETSTRPAV